MKSSKIISFISVFLLTCAGILFAQTSESGSVSMSDSADSSKSSYSDYSDDDAVIIVSASKIQQKLGDSVEKVQVVSAEEIKESGAKTLTEAVKNLPGVSVKSASAGNPTDSISMQGFDSNYVKILIDGIAVSGDIGGSKAVFQIPVENVDHIEVVQGASSALYGSDAMGGVINIITKKTKQEFDGVKVHGNLSEEFSYSIEKDLRNYAAGSLSVAGKHFSSGLTGSFDYAPGLQKSQYYALSGGYVDYYETPKKQLLYLRGTADWTDDWGKVGAYGLFADAKQKSNYTAVGFSTGSTMEYDTDRIEGGLNAEYNYDNNLSFSGFSSVKGFILKTDYDVKASSDAGATDSDSNFIDWESELRTNWKINGANQLLIGFNANLQTIDGDSFKERKKQLLLSVFAQDSWKPVDRLSIVPGFRFDCSPEMDGASASVMITPKLSLRFDATDTTVIRFSYGMGYKTPTLKQKYWVFRHAYSSGEGNFWLYGDPDLKPEKSQSFNLGLEQNIFNLAKLNVSGYFNYVTDMIDSVVTDSVAVPQIRKYVNVDKAMTYGGEASISVKLDRFDARTGYAYTGALQEENGSWSNMALRVTHRVSFGAGYLIPGIETKISADGEWNSRQLLKVNSDEYTPDYFMLGAMLSKQFFDGKLNVYLRAENILNNKNFINGTDGKNQKEYFGLNAGTTFTIGGCFKF